VWHDMQLKNVKFYISCLKFYGIDCLLYFFLLWVFCYSYTLVLGMLILKEECNIRSGMKSALYMECSSCKVRTYFDTSDTVNDGKSNDVNRRAVFFALESGIGFNGLEKFSIVFNSPNLNRVAYYKQVQRILSAVTIETEKELQEAGIRLRHLLKSQDCRITDTSVLDVAVSFDGTWAKRGHTSLLGVVFVISVDSGEALDFEVLSKHCKVCSHLESYKTKDPERFSTEFDEHKKSGDCKINYEGSSNAMEVRGALRLWHRSLQKHNFRYTVMVSDGDSKAHRSVSDSNCYGDGVTIEKIDCIGHVQKRMGKRLLNLKSTTKGKLKDGKPIGGKGRLTESAIKRLQRYYGLAIRQNTVRSSNPTNAERQLAVYQMRRNIMALLSHTICRDDLTIQHRYCPTGRKSWCSWQRDKAIGTSSFVAKDCLPEIFMDLLKPIFIDLSTDELLQRCVVGATQNANESINSLVWQRCQKQKFNGASIVQFAAATAILQFNGGSSVTAKLLDSMGTPVITPSKKRLSRRDKHRINQAVKKRSGKEKMRRALAQQLKAAKEDAYKEKEGASYAGGSF